MGAISKKFATVVLTAAGAAGLVGSTAGYAVHKHIVTPKEQESARLADFNARGQRILSSLRMRPIEFHQFAQGAQGCEASEHGASFVAEDFDNKIVYGVMCVSQRSELSFRILR